jgi:hypothetical protein
MNGLERMRDAMLRFFNLFPFFDLDELIHQKRVDETVKGEIAREQNFLEREFLGDRRVRQ